MASASPAQSTNGVFYYFSDHLKTASVITDSAGNIKSESDFYPWGGELQFVNNDSNHYKFTGKERDSETQLDYFGARHYSNGLGRWISADWSPTPIPVPYADFYDPQTLNLYQFVGGNPASKADPDGHAGPDLEAAIIDFVTVTYGPRVLPAVKSVANDIGNAASNFLDEAAHGFNAAYSNCSCNPQPAQSSPEEDSKQNNNNSKQQSSTEQGRDAQGKFTSKQPGQSAPGAAAEKEGLDSVGAVKNKSEILNGTKRDGTIPETGEHVEVKSGASVNDTEQLRNMGQAAMDATGKPLKVITTNPNAHVSVPAQKNPNLDIKPLKKE